MSLEKAKIGEAIYDVVGLDEFMASPTSFGPYTAINGNDGYIYPVRSKTDSRPGFYPTGGIDYFKMPLPSEGQMYSQANVINFKEASSLREIIQAQQKLMSAERSILTTIDSVFAPEIGESDMPEMKAMKEAIREKHIDLDKYESRFGPNYNNDKRLLRRGTITFGKLRSICDALDIRATLSLEDKAPDVPNPIGRVISVDLTSEDMTLEDEEES